MQLKKCSSLQWNVYKKNQEKPPKITSFGQKRPKLTRQRFVCVALSASKRLLWVIQINYWQFRMKKYHTSVQFSSVQYGNYSLKYGTSVDLSARLACFMLSMMMARVSGHLSTVLFTHLSWFFRTFCKDHPTKIGVLLLLKQHKRINYRHFLQNVLPPHIFPVTESRKNYRV